MKLLLLLMSSLLLAGALASAQDTLGSGAKPNSQAPSQSSTAQNTVIRGCLSGSAGNFTLTDQNGMQYKLMGDAAKLQSKVGHEIEVTGMESQSTGSGVDQGATALAPNGFQVSDVRDVSGSCRLGWKGDSQPSPQ
ncbi:MAG: hypothetical protein WCC87_24885 [Candidatus Korobacteraceae bacterium]